MATYLNYQDLKIKYIVKKDEGMVIAVFDCDDEIYVDAWKEKYNGCIKQNFLDKFEDMFFTTSMRLTEFSIRVDEMKTIIHLNKEHDSFNEEYGKALARKIMFRKFWVKAARIIHQRATFFNNLVKCYEKIEKDIKTNEIDKYEYEVSRFIHEVDPATFPSKKKNA